MKKLLQLLYIVFFICNCAPTFAQDTKKTEIAKSLNDYFLLERENIHVQFDKSNFTTEEDIWFKGYVYHRKKEIPFFSTTNVFAALINSEGKIIKTQLLYSNIGSFSGSVALDSSFASGRYYLQFYTNWMNNFKEDESFTYEVNIINPNDGKGTLSYKGNDLTIALNTEGGVRVKDIQNSIGVSVSDCFGNAVAVSSLDIVTEKGEVIQKVQLNKRGYGKAVLPPGQNDNLKAVVAFKDKNYEKELPKAQVTGIGLDVNNYSVPGKVIIKLKTNDFGLSSNSGNNFYVVVHQDEKAVIFDADFSNKEKEQTLVINSSDLFNGLNTIRLLDNQNNELGVRLIYNYPVTTLTAEVKKTTPTDEMTIRYKGKISYPNMNISIAALPENTVSLDQENDIYSSLQIAPYIKNAENINGKYYFNTLSKGKHYELDLFLLNQKSKCEWRTIIASPPKDNFTFDMGLTLKGSLKNYPGNHKGENVRLYSLTSGIDVLTSVDENNEFTFENLVIPDSAFVNFTLVKQGLKPKELTITPIIANGYRPYYKMFHPENSCISNDAVTNSTLDTASDLPKIFFESIQLSGVTIEGNRLKYDTKFGNANLRGYKISDSETYMYQNLLNFLKTYSNFNVTNSNGTVTIYNRTTNTINGGQSSPIVYIDNVQLIDYSMLSNIQMSEVDEIYINGHAIVPSVRNYMGIIKIYLNKGGKMNSKSGTKDIVINNGYKKILPFENINYGSTNDKGYDNLGLIYWEPQLMTDEKGEFEINIPKTGQKNIKLVIEGFSADGKLISEIITVPGN